MGIKRFWKIFTGRVTVGEAVDLVMALEGGPSTYEKLADRIIERFPKFTQGKNRQQVVWIVTDYIQKTSW
jgi:hypothetical protein